MTDLDAIKRTLADIESSLTLLNSQFVTHVEVLASIHSTQQDMRRRLKAVEDKLQPVPTSYGPAPKSDEQWCRCGRDVCRYPACSSKVVLSDKPDPLGR